jgi:DNA-directed RNA polymerase specialized sigma24 family protein
MKTHPALTEEQFNSLLAWLDPDSRRAADKYEVIRAGLIQRFISRQCVDAEGLADETINRVALKVGELEAKYKGNPASYFHGVAKNVLYEHFRDRQETAKRPPPEPEPLFDDIYFDCLKKCLERLPSEKRDLILRYYGEMGQAKITSRRQIRRQLKLDANALRQQMLRIRRKLGPCVRECVEQSAERNGMA